MAAELDLFAAIDGFSADRRELMTLLVAGAQAQPRQASASVTPSAFSDAFTVKPEHDDNILGLAGNAFYSVTLGPASEYRQAFSVTLVNEDGWSSGRAKWIFPTGGQGFYLWPGQAAILINHNGAWRCLRNLRARPPQSVTLNVDPTNGSDALGAADGLATVSGAFASCHRAIQTAYGEFDFLALGGRTEVTVSLVGGAIDDKVIHYSPAAAVGAIGGNPIVIDGNSTGVLAGGVQVYFGGLLALQNVTLRNAGGTAVSATQHGKVYIGANVVFGPTSSAHMVVDSGAVIYLSDSYGIAGGAACHIEASSHAVVSSANGTITVTADIAFGNLLSVSGAYVDLRRITWALGGHTVTGSKYRILHNGVVLGTANIPGSVAGTTSSGGQAA